MTDDEFSAVTETAQPRDTSVSGLLRTSLRQHLADEEALDPERQLAAILRFARFAGPTGDIDQILPEIEAHDVRSTLSEAEATELAVEAQHATRSVAER